MIEAAERGWDIISANFLMPRWVATHRPNFVAGCSRTGRVASPQSWRVVKSIFVADDMPTARAYATAPASPYRHYYDAMQTKMKEAGRIKLFKADPDMPDDLIPLDDICAELVIFGTPAAVTEQLLGLRETVGDFGTLRYAGHDWVDPALARRLMVLIAEQVLPAVNRAIGGRPAAA